VKEVGRSRSILFSSSPFFFSFFIPLFLFPPPLSLIHEPRTESKIGLTRRERDDENKRNGKPPSPPSSPSLSVLTQFLYGRAFPLAMSARRSRALNKRLVVGSLFFSFPFLPFPFPSSPPTAPLHANTLRQDIDQGKTAALQRLVAALFPFFFLPFPFPFIYKQRRGRAREMEKMKADFFLSPFSFSFFFSFP